MKPSYRIPSVVAIILAAGHSRRMGGDDKLLKTIHGIPLIRRVLLAALGSHCRDTSLVLQPGQDRRTRSISDLPVQLIFSMRAASGMAASLASGITAQPVHHQAAGALILLADMPDIDSTDIDRLLRGFVPGRIVAATCNGKLGHPVILPRELWPAACQLNGDVGARSLLQNNPDLLDKVELPFAHAITDLDTPADWEVWQNQDKAVPGSAISGVTD